MACINPPSPDQVSQPSFPVGPTALGADDLAAQPCNVSEPMPRSTGRLAFTLGRAAIDAATHGQITTDVQSRGPSRRDTEPSPRFNARRRYWTLSAQR